LSNDANNSERPPNRLLVTLRLVYAELQYWLIGLTPEDYHWRMASAWEDLGNFDRAARHLKSYLQSSENAQVRALLAYCYARLGSWSLAAEEYRIVIAAWSHPTFILGLAEAKFELGDATSARALAELVEREHPSREPYVQQALLYLRARLDSPPATSAGRVE
jgi:hypothetical protein